MQSNGISISGWVTNGRGEATQVGLGTGSTESLGLTWDWFGRLRAVKYAEGSQSYLYAPSGMRVASMESASTSGTRRFAYTTGGLLLSEYRDQAALNQNLRTTVATTSSRKTATSSSGPSTAAGGMAYLLPQAGVLKEPAGAWIVQPGGNLTASVGQTISFSGETDYGTTLTWTFGDGTSVSGGSASHAFAAVGTYTVSFRASRMGFLTSTATVVITVAQSLPVIGSFTASATTIAEGGYADLSWSVGNATSISISGVGAVAATGTARVWPSGTTSYVLTASSSGGTATSTVLVTVVLAPIIRVFTSEPVSIQPGQATRLTWTVENATSYSLGPWIGPVPGTWAMVWPGSTMTFTLTATNQQNGVSVVRTANTTISVGPTSATVWKRDVIYLGTEAIAEVDANGIHELHNDHLGSPTIITSGSTGQIEGRQVFGPFGERVKSEGYRPLIGYTGHVQQDATGLIYMRGRYYSPAWHRFVNSDQGADRNSWNQMAYVGGKPLMRTDPSGMEGEDGEDGVDNSFDVWGWWGWSGRQHYGGYATVEVTDAFAVVPGNYVMAEPSPWGLKPEPLGPKNNDNVIQPQTPQPPKTYSECMATCAMDVAIRNMPGVLGTVGGPPGAAVALAYAPVDAFGGGINPMSNATGFSAYFSVNNPGYSADPGAIAGDISTWLTKAFDNSSFRNKVVSTLNSMGKTLGQASAITRAFSKALPIIGAGSTLNSIKNDIKTCQERCEKFK